jgi:hypothetical protein
VTVVDEFLRVPADADGNAALIVIERKFSHPPSQVAVLTTQRKVAGAILVHLKGQEFTVVVLFHLERSHGFFNQNLTDAVLKANVGL